MAYKKRRKTRQRGKKSFFFFHTLGIMVFFFLMMAGGTYGAYIFFLQPKELPYFGAYPFPKKTSIIAAKKKQSPYVYKDLVEKKPMVIPGAPHEDNTDHQEYFLDEGFFDGEITTYNVQKNLGGQNISPDKKHFAKNNHNEEDQEGEEDNETDTEEEEEEKEGKEEKNQKIQKPGAIAYGDSKKDHGHKKKNDHQNQNNHDVFATKNTPKGKQDTEGQNNLWDNGQKQKIPQKTSLQRFLEKQDLKKSGISPSVKQNSESRNATNTKNISNEEISGRNNKNTKQNPTTPTMDSMGHIPPSQNHDIKISEKDPHVQNVKHSPGIQKSNTVEEEKTTHKPLEKSWQVTLPLNSQ